MSQNENQKGGRLDEEVLTDEVIASSEHVLKRGGSFGNQKGLQQHFTPPKVARFIALVLGSSRNVIDLTAGDGSLLSGFGVQHQFGIEIDGSQVRRGEYQSVKGDVQHVVPLLAHLRAEWPLAVLNPPFGLDDWSDPSIKEGRKIGSTLLTFLLADKLLNSRGAGVIICGRDRFAKDILPEHSERFFATFEVDDLWDDVALPCVVAFYARRYRPSYDSGGSAVISKKISASELNADNAGLIDAVKQAARAVNPYCLRASYGEDSGHDNLVSYMKAAQVEYNRRLGDRLKGRKSKYDLSVQSGKMHYAPTPYARLNLERSYQHEYLTAVHKKSIGWFVFNRQEWRKIKTIENDVEGFTIDPQMDKMVEAVIEAAADAKRPLYALKPQQRIGFLPDDDHIVCKKADPMKGFEEGEKYLVTCSDAERRDHEENRPVKTNSGTELQSFVIRHKYLKITIKSGTRYYAFGESKEEIEYLLEHFEMPDPGTVETAHPEKVKHYYDLLKSIQAEQKGTWPYDDPERGRVKGEPAPWDFFPFQLSDLSRAAVKERVILAWEQGGGKTLAEIAWIKMMFASGKEKKALIVCPQDLIAQTCDEWQRFVGERPRIIASYEAAIEIAKDLRAGGEGVFITHYEMLSRSGSCDVPLPDEWCGEQYTKRDGSIGTIGLMGYKYTPKHMEPDWDATGKYIEVEVEAEFHRYNALTRCPQCGADYDASWRPPTGTKPGQCVPHKIAKVETWVDSQGKTRTKTTHGCGYRHVGDPKGMGLKGRTTHHRKKPVASLFSKTFKDGVIVLDEITKIKGDSSQVAKAVRGLQCHCWLGLSGTPIKNYIHDAFWPMWRIIGDNVPRFPYDYEGKNTFSQDFSAYEWQIKEDGNKGAGKPTAQVTNLMKLWPLMGASYIRKRKEEMGVEVVPKTFYPTIVPNGVEQRRQMDKWLKSFPKFFEERNPEAPVVKAGMHAFLAPILGLNEKLRWVSVLPESDEDASYWGIPVSNWTPKNVKTLEIAMHHAAKGDRVLIGSTRIDTAEWMMNELAERGVETQTLLEFPEDGPPKTKNPAKRSAIIKEFQAGEAQVLCSTLEAMAFGHNLDKASVVIIQGLPWDYATLDQFLARVHRLSSTKPVSIYVILGKGSIDERMWQLLTDKGDSAQLALDGRLIEQDIEEIKEADVIRELMESGIPVQGDEVPEVAIKEAWEHISSVEDLGEFTRPEAADVLSAKAEKTDATTFEEPVVPARTVESYHIQQLEPQMEEDETGGELRDRAEPEAVGEEGQGVGEVPSGTTAEVEEAEPEEERPAEVAEVVEEERPSWMHESPDEHLTDEQIAAEVEPLPGEPPFDEPVEEPRELVAAGGQSFFDFDF